MSEKPLADMTPEEFRSEFLHLLDMYSDGGIGCDHLADKITTLRDADRAAAFREAAEAVLTFAGNNNEYTPAMLAEYIRALAAELEGEK